MNAVHDAGYVSEVMQGLTSGDTTDWTYGLFRIPSITMELRPTATTGGSGFLVPLDQILPTCEENLVGALYLIAWNEADINNDYIVNLQDFAILASYWLTPISCDRGDPDDPSIPDNDCCDCADIFGSYTVDIDDLRILSDQWGAISMENFPPTPNPMTFSSPPAATGTTTVIMTAATATDSSGVEYYFTCTAGAGHDSGWQPDRTYRDNGLTLGVEYTYTVKARDKSDAHYETAASDPASAITADVIIIENILLPANGGVLDEALSSYTEYGGGWVAAALTNGSTDEDGWCNAKDTDPEPQQEFVFSFRDNNFATLTNAVIHGGTAEDSTNDGSGYYSKDVEVWTSPDDSTFTLAGTGTLINTHGSTVDVNLTGIVAKYIKLVITSGYKTDYWELAEFQVNGDVIE
jgi:hypothetical protein